MARVLGVDYGSARVGFAISDEDGVFAFPKKVVASTWEVIQSEVEALLKENNIHTIVVGLPQNFHGEDTEQTARVRAFAEILRSAFPLPIIFQNEVLTSKQVDKSGGSTKDMQDASAAALILQQFLDNKRLQEKNSEAG